MFCFLFYLLSHHFIPPSFNSHKMISLSLLFSFLSQYFLAPSPPTGTFPRSVEKFSRTQELYLLCPPEEFTGSFLCPYLQSWKKSLHPKATNSLEFCFGYLFRIINFAEWSNTRFVSYTTTVFGYQRRETVKQDWVNHRDEMFPKTFHYVGKNRAKTLYNSSSSRLFPCRRLHVKINFLVMRSTADVAFMNDVTALLCWKCFWSFTLWYEALKVRKSWCLPF